MPIRINLLNEVLAEEDLRRRDPVKRAIFVGIFLSVLTLAWYSSTWLEYKLTQQSLNRVTDEMQSLTNDFNKVQADLKKISDGQRQLDALQQLSTNRFLQGNLMNALQQVYVSGVQLQQVKIEQGYTLVPGTADKTNEWGVVQRGRPFTSAQAVMLSLQARDSSSNPGDQVNPYKDALAKLDYFKSNLNPTNGVKLASLSAPQISASGRSYVIFSLECRFITR
jgi:hypothetical protein